MKTSSCKAKGRNLQKYIVKRILYYCNALEPDDVQSRSMGCPGEDIMLSPKARSMLPISIEAKNQEAINVWAAYEQSKANAKHFEPVLVIKKNGKKPLAVVDLDFLISAVSLSTRFIYPHEPTQKSKVHSNDGEGSCQT